MQKKLHLIEAFREQIPGLLVNGPDPENAAPHIVSLGFPNVRGEVMLHALESDGVYASTGSACSSKKLKVSGVFPFRRETLAKLECVVTRDRHWKFRYLLAALKAYFGFDEEADALLESCGDEPDEAVFYQYRATRRKGDAAIADLIRAKGIEDSWRIGRHLTEIYEKKNDFTKVLEVTTEYLKTWPDRDPLRLAHANALLKLKRYRECIAYLETVTLLPSEHRGSGTAIWHEAQDALGLTRTWPENLGKGEPYPDAK
jgi:tetratricopeptide (TPR) repeat protein